MNDMSEKRVNPQLTFALRICKNFFAPAFMLRRQMPFCKDAALAAVADVYTEMISNASNLKVANQVAAQACGLIPDVLDPRE